MNKVQILEHMIDKYKNNIDQLKLELESADADKRARARDAIDYARKQIAEGEEIIEKEKNRKCCTHDCATCKDIPEIFKEQAS